MKLFESKYGDSPDNFHISREGDTLDVQLTYPPWSDEDNKNGKVRFVTFDQEAVRASDGIRIHYDYARDGYVIEQPQKLSWESDDVLCDPLWKEVAFVKSWASNIDEESK